MTDIEICESIIKAGTCNSLKSLQCDDCPLNNNDEFDCKYAIEASSLQAAKYYLTKHKKEEKKELTREEAIVAMLEGKKVTNDLITDVESYCYYNPKESFPFRFVTSYNGYLLGIFNATRWYLYKEPKVKKYQWAYKSKNKFCPQETKPTGEVSKHLTEEEAKELYGEDIIKLPFTEIEE
jgi:hypothetical protein